MKERIKKRDDGAIAEMENTTFTYREYMPWKWDTASYWIGHAHEIGLPVHIGRVSSFKDLDKAYMLGADSVDGSTIIRHDLLERIPLFRSHVLEQGRFDHRHCNLCKAVVSDEMTQNGKENEVRE